MSRYAAVDNIKAIAKFLKGLNSLAEEIEAGLSIEQAAEEASSKLKKMRQEVEQFRAEYEESKSRYESQKSLADSVLEKAESDAKKHLEAASAEYSKIIADANTKAYEKKVQSEIILQEARNAAKKIEADIEVLRQEKSQLESVVSQLKSELQEIKRKFG